MCISSAHKLTLYLHLCRGIFNRPSSQQSKALYWIRHLKSWMVPINFWKVPIYKVLVPYTISVWVHKLEMWNLVSHRILPLSPSWRRWSWYCWSSGDSLRTCTHTSRHSPPSEGSRWPLPSVSRWRMSSPFSLGTWRSVSQWEGISPERYASFFLNVPPSPKLSV